MKDVKNPKIAVEKSIAMANSFVKAEKESKDILVTYGYFVNHPISPLNKKRLTLILQNIQNVATRKKRNLKVLDLACGGGLISGSIALMGHTVIGIDNDQKEIEYAKKFFKRNNLKGQFYTYDLLINNKWQKKIQKNLNGKPDVVILAYALHHFPNVNIFLKNLSKWLNSNSYLVINEENLIAPFFRIKHIVRTFIQKDTDVEDQRSLPEWEKILNNNQFYINDVSYTDLIPFMDRVFPSKSWSIVLLASKSKREKKYSHF